MYKTKFIDVSRWEKVVHYHTMGTRNKSILTSLQGDVFYFKKSLLKPNKDYRYEFWSEIIASQIGHSLGFDVVLYNVAYFKNEIGCISKSIIDINNEELIEGYRYIVEKYPDFQDNFRKGHSFQKIIGALKKLGLNHCIQSVIKMIIFDAIIGNADRHSENWAVVISNKKLKEVISIVEKLPQFQKWIFQFKLFLRTKGRVTMSKVHKNFKKQFYNFSPLYDNGSSLGRELGSKKIDELMNRDDEFRKFINKGKPDIRWNNRNLNHFELVRTLNIDYPKEVGDIITEIRNKYNKKILENIVNGIDKKTPKQFLEYKIPQKRKEFIIKYIDSRIKILIDSNEQI